jgi:hypothetical protein
MIDQRNKEGIFMNKNFKMLLMVGALTSLEVMAQSSKSIECQIGRPEELVSLHVKTAGDGKASIRGETGAYGDAEFKIFLQESGSVSEDSISKEISTFFSMKYHKINEFTFPSADISIYRILPNEKMSTAPYLCQIHYKVSASFKEEYLKKNASSILWNDATTIFGFEDE